MEKQKQERDYPNSKVEKPNSMNSIWTPKALRKRLAKGLEARTKFVESQISNGIAFQIRALRHRENWSQPKLAEKVGTTQNQIYRLENPATAKPTISTLKRIAAVFDVALVVRFVPFNQAIAWASSTPFIDKGLSTQSLAVPNFAKDMASIDREAKDIVPASCPDQQPGRQIENQIRFNPLSSPREQEKVIPFALDLYRFPVGISQPRNHEENILASTGEKDPLMEGMLNEQQRGIEAGGGIR